MNFQTLLCNFNHQSSVFCSVILQDVPNPDFSHVVLVKPALFQAWWEPWNWNVLPPYIYTHNCTHMHIHTHTHTTHTHTQPHSTWYWCCSLLPSLLVPLWKFYLLTPLSPHDALQAVWLHQSFLGNVWRNTTNEMRALNQQFHNGCVHLEGVVHRTQDVQWGAGEVGGHDNCKTAGVHEGVVHSRSNGREEFQQHTETLERGKGRYRERERKIANSTHTDTGEREGKITHSTHRLCLRPCNTYV